MTTLFISDLHLTAARPEITALFLDFLADEGRGADALYILGDLFEYWIGDEAVDAPEYRPMIAGLRALSDAGVPLYVMHGNRDFLMGPGFEHATGCRLLPDPARIDLYGTAVLLSHGDALCTRDQEYMAFRAIVRGTEWQQGFLAKSVAEREAIARNYRELSRQSTAAKRAEIMDVTPEAVSELMRGHGVRHLIHGHTHRPAEHLFELDGAPARRVVLGDWYDQGSVLRCKPAGWSLATIMTRTARAQRARSS